MKQNIKALLLSTVFVAAGSLAANAGGLVEPFGGLKDGGYAAPAPILQPMGGSLKDAPMAPAQTGWYIRGDLGYSSYANVGGYIGEHQQFIGSNMIGTDGTLTGDTDGSCQLGSAGDLQYTDTSYVFDAAGNRLYTDGNYYANDAAAVAVDPANILSTTYKDANGNPIPADGYIYWRNPTSNELVRYNPSATNYVDAGGIITPIPTFDPATGVVNGDITQPTIDGNTAGIWEVYNGTGWQNVAAVYNDNAGNKTVMVWDAAGGGWGDRQAGAGATPFAAQDLIDAVRAFSSGIPLDFLNNSAGLLSTINGVAGSREQSWLNMAAAAAGRSTCNIGRQALTSADIDDTWTIGGGVGYYFNSHWRGDLTFDYRANSDVTAKHDFLDEWGAASITATHTAELSSFVALANLYYDFGDRSGFSPYLGAGIGFSVNRMGDRNITCWNNTANASCGADATGAGDSNTDVAAAAMVGFTKALGSNLKLDVGYRYLYMGDAQSGNEMAAADAGSQGQLVLEDLTAHEIRVGLRYDFGCGTCR